MALIMLLIALLGTVAFTSSLMLLPAVIELRHPKDAGPRLIIENFALQGTMLKSLEDENTFNIQLLQLLSGYCPDLPSLEL